MIEKIVLRDQVREYLQKEMIERNITFGEKLSLAEIARKIDVSVTPIREALTQLEQVGIVQTIANRGFFVPSLTYEEAKDIYPIIINLESMAVQASVFSDEQIAKLKTAQEAFEAATTNELAVKADLEFHKILIEGYKNNIASRILKDLKFRVFFYELEFMNHADEKQQSFAYHRQMIEQALLGKTDKVAKLLEENWQSSLHLIKDLEKL